MLAQKPQLGFIKMPIHYLQLECRLLPPCVLVSSLGALSVVAVGPLVAGAVAVFTTLPLPHYWQASQMASYYYFFLSSTRRRGASGALAGGAGP